MLSVYRAALIFTFCFLYALVSPKDVLSKTDAESTVLYKWTVDEIAKTATMFKSPEAVESSIDREFDAAIIKKMWDTLEGIYNECGITPEWDRNGIIDYHEYQDRVEQIPNPKCLPKAQAFYEFSKAVNAELTEIYSSRLPLIYIFNFKTLPEDYQYGEKLKQLVAEALKKSGYIANPIAFEDFAYNQICFTSDRECALRIILNSGKHTGDYMFSINVHEPDSLANKGIFMKVEYINWLVGRLLPEDNSDFDRNNKLPKKIEALISQSSIVLNAIDIESKIQKLKDDLNQIGITLNSEEDLDCTSCSLSEPEVGYSKWLDANKIIAKAREIPSFSKVCVSDDSANMSDWWNPDRYWIKALIKHKMNSRLKKADKGFKVVFSDSMTENAANSTNCWGITLTNRELHNLYTMAWQARDKYKYFYKQSTNRLPFAELGKFGTSF